MKNNLLVFGIKDKIYNSVFIMRGGKMLNDRVKNIIRSSYLSAFDGGTREISYLILIGTKIISGNKSNDANSVDIDRLYDELVYYKYYSSMTDIYLLNFTLPLILTSRAYGLYQDQVIDLLGKVIKFYKQEYKKYDYILDQYIYDSLYRYTLVNSKFDILDFLYVIKGKLLIFNPYKDNKKENIGLQVRKIKYIDDLHYLISYFEIGEERYQKEIKLNSSFLTLLREAYDGDGIILDMGLESVKSVITNLLYIEDKNYKMEENIKYKDVLNMKEFTKDSYNIREDISGLDLSFIQSMADYCIRLRNNEINSRKYRDIYEQKSSPKKLLEYGVGDVFMDPVLNRSQVLTKEYKNQLCEMKIKTKTGIYGFVFRGKGD